MFYHNYKFIIYNINVAATLLLKEIGYNGHSIHIYHNNNNFFIYFLYFCINSSTIFFRSKRDHSRFQREACMAGGGCPLVDMSEDTKVILFFLKDDFLIPESTVDSDDKKNSGCKYCITNTYKQYSCRSLCLITNYFIAI